MTKFLSSVNLILLIATSICGLMFYFHTDFYNFMIQEDGILENLTALMLLASSILFVIKIVRLKQNRTTFWLIVNIFLAAGLFFGFGEEISWGQRIFNVEAGEFFSENNLQNETNLHNLQFGDFKVNRIIFSIGFSLVFGIYFLLTQILYIKQTWFTNLIDTTGVPVPRAIHSALFLGLTIFISTVPDGKIWEIWECLFALTFFWIVLTPFNKNEKALAD